MITLCLCGHHLGAHKVPDGGPCSYCLCPSARPATLEACALETLRVTQQLQATLQTLLDQLPKLLAPRVADVLICARCGHTRAAHKPRCEVLHAIPPIECGCPVFIMERA